MKFHFFLLPLLALLPVAASAQIPAKALKTAPQISVDPAAKALTDRAMATYKNAAGLRFRVQLSLSKADTSTTVVSFARPGMVRIDGENDTNSLRYLLDGKNYYSVQNATYRKQPASEMAVSLLVGSGGFSSSAFMAAMLEGKNPLSSWQDSFLQPPVQNFKGTTIALAPRVIDGDVLSGTQSTFSFRAPGSNGAEVRTDMQTTAWFGGSPLVLRRTQTRYSQNGKVAFTMTEKVSDQQFNPTFAPDTFKFNATGLKLVSNDAAAAAPAYWDARLKVGTQPFTFQTKTIDGKTVSPAQYKGKVLLMDFWATWCGPCVAGLPEIQATYNKYHAQGLEVVGISLDREQSDLTTFIKARKMAWPQVFDHTQKTSVAKIYGVQAIPFLLIIGRDGKIAAVNPRGKIDEAVKTALAAS